ncbi:MAG: glycosyl hydrolase [Caulobacteraceae bacterium]|nr:MAG: glycosyl hydrolase [Caulobacteraceae bacterium]
MMRLIVLILAAFGLIAAPACAQERPVRVLYLSQSVGWLHEPVKRTDGALSSSEVAMQAWARDTGAFTVEVTQDARDITPAKLADLDVLVFYTTGALPIDQATWTAIQEWIGSGRGGFVGLHSAADTALAFPGGDVAYRDFIGGVFDGHPWTQGTPIRLTNLEPGHPLAATWPDSVEYAEEIYQYAGFRPETVRVLQTLDMSFGPIRRPYAVPVTWVKPVGENGRLFFTNLGHTPSTWDDPRYRDQVVAGIRWVAHRTEAPMTPNPQVQDQTALTAFAAVHGLSPLTPADPAATAAAIRALQPLSPDKHDGETAEWDRANQRILDSLE